MLSSPTEKLNEWVEKHSMSFDARGLLHATPKDADGRCWHVRDVTPAATRAAAIKGGADIPARHPVHASSKMSYTQSTFV
jgi:hypothetical protein